MQQVDHGSGVISTRPLVPDEQRDILTSDNVPKSSGLSGAGVGTGSEKPSQPQLKCPRCDSSNTKFCYYNNYSLTQPRHFCKNCRRYWTQGGALRNVPVGGGCRKNKRSTPTGINGTIGVNNISTPSKQMNVRRLGDQYQIHHQYLYPPFNDNSASASTSNILARLSSTLLPPFPSTFSNFSSDFNHSSSLQYDPTAASLFELNTLPPLIPHKPVGHTHHQYSLPQNIINATSHNMNNLLINPENILVSPNYLNPQSSHTTSTLDHTNITYNNNLNLTNVSNLYDHLITPFLDTNIQLPSNVTANVVSTSSATATLALIEDHELSDFSTNVSSSTNINSIDPGPINFNMNKDHNTSTLVGPQVLPAQREYNHGEQDFENIPILNQKERSSNAHLQHRHIGVQKNIPLQLLDHIHHDKDEEARVTDTHANIGDLSINEEMKELSDTNGISLAVTQNLPWNIQQQEGNTIHEMSASMFKYSQGDNDLDGCHMWSNMR